MQILLFFADFLENPNQNPHYDNCNNHRPQDNNTCKRRIVVLVGFFSDELHAPNRDSKSDKKIDANVKQYAADDDIHALTSFPTDS